MYAASSANTDRICGKTVEKGETKQYGGELRHFMQWRRGNSDHAYGIRGSSIWRNSHTGGMGGRGGPGRSRSEAVSWRKEKVQ